MDLFVLIVIFFKLIKIDTSKGKGDGWAVIRIAPGQCKDQAS